MNIFRVILIAVMLSLAHVNATPTRGKPDPQKPCSTPEYRQFDFWIGQWDTFDVDEPKKVIARNHVESMLGGCAIREVYEQNDGLVGESFSAYDATRRLWHQSWVTNRGRLLLLEGGVTDGKMILTGDDRSTDRKSRLLRGIWYKQDDGVRETAQVSTDNGKSWQPLFDIIFKPAKSTARTSATDKEALVALENNWLNAEHDPTTLDRILAPDFAHPVVTGDFLTKEQHIYYSTRRQPRANLKRRFDQLNVRVYRDVGIVNGIVVSSDENGKERDRTIFTDVFAYRDGHWQAVNAQENKVQLIGN